MPNSLEQQAMERVSRMYGSFDRRQPGHSAPAQHRRPDPPPAPSEPEEPPVPPEKPPKPPGLLEQLMEDREQSLLMLLLVILMKDGADMSTVLALMYLLI